MNNMTYTWQEVDGTQKNGFEDVSLDINGGIGLNSAAYDYFTGIGISYRFC